MTFLKKGDLYFILAGILFLISLYIFQNLNNYSIEGAKVFLNGKNIFNITKDGTYTIKNESGNILMHVEYKNKMVRALDSTCKLKVCIDTGWVNNASQDIICIPNKIVIKPIGKKKKNGVDLITW
ncbi:lipoprotein [Tepiditoga spiralis]|uniref:Lipoprotein n=1 Tax=Tepiditoga spiralis TaxID=2108365 RepID=A0A7G1GAB7_9BACT|nr:NusG domain II-containing protein [Tepiditoga spiralis]BBE32043.1 lipoprotein [Tepiditoga spiralis]